MNLPAKYCSVRTGVAITAVVAHGCVGVWRVKNYNFHTPDSEVIENVQPEEDGDFTLIEFGVGKYCNSILF